MNCQDFEDAVIDLVRDCATDDAVRVAALKHAESCDQCAARLAEERALSAALRRKETCEVPVRIESAILTAYRMRHAPAARAARHGKRGMQFAYWSIAAALLVAILGVTTFRWMRPGSSARETMTSNPATRLPVASASAPGAAAPEGVYTGSKAEPDSAVKGTSAKPAVPEEIATDFIPLTSSAEIDSMESGQLVRVLLPRSALALYGLPVNQERADTPVSAQILLGQDGVAHAIRFLTPANANVIQTGMRSKR